MTLGLDDEEFAILEDLVGQNQIIDAKKILGKARCARGFFIESAISLAENDIDGALTSLEECMNRSRTPSTRNPVLEARARMLRGLCRSGLGERIEASADLRWAMDRLNAIDSGSEAHGIAVLNVAAWHRQNGEPVMALATHSEIARENTHVPEIVAVSRQRVAAIHAELGDLAGSIRHHWTAWKIARDTGMSVIAEASCLHIIDLGLANVDAHSERMSVRIENSRPEPRKDPTEPSIHPTDLKDVTEWIVPRVLSDVSGKQRVDMQLVVEALNILDSDLIERFQEIKDSVQDPVVLEALQ